MSSEAKVAYLRGLIDGCNLVQGDKNKEKFLAGLIDALQTMTEEIQVLQDETQDTSDFLDMVSQDVLNLKQGEGSSCSCDCDDFERNCDDCVGCTCDCDECEEEEECGGCEGCKKLADESSEENDSDMEEFDQMTCPHCGEKFYFDATSYEDGDKLICPYCGKTSVYSE